MYLPTHTNLYLFFFFSFLLQIASGAFGSVYKCLMKDENTTVAIKLIPLPRSIHDRCGAPLSSSTALFDSLGHTTIPPF